MNNAQFIPVEVFKTLAATDKGKLPVSMALAADGTKIVISRYSDNIWDFWPYVPQENKADSQKRINWHIRMPDGLLLTDEKYVRLLESSKDFIWSLFAHPVDGRPRPKMLTIIGRVRAPLAHLLKWMSLRGLMQFRQLQGHAMDYVVVAKQGVVPAAAAARLFILEDLHYQAHKITDGLLNHPWPFETSSGLAGLTGSAGSYKSKTPVIPDVVIRKLMTHAIEYVELKSKRLLDIREAFYKAADKSANKHYRSVIYTRISREFGFKDATELNAELITLRTACYIVIAFFSGIRDSEIMSLSANCVVHGKNKDGIDLIWMHGSIYKTGLQAKKWLVPPIVEIAIQVLERFTEEYRRRLVVEECELQKSELPLTENHKEKNAKRLHKVRRHKDKLFLTETMCLGRPISVITGSAMNHYLKVFCNIFEIHGEDGQPWPLAAHQFRRTYAYYYAKSELGDLLYLQEHFGHHSLDMTLLYADKGVDHYEVDTELLDDIVKAKQKRQIEILTGFVNDKARLANGEQWIGEWRRTIRTAKNKEELIEGLSGTLSLAGTGHSWCAASAKGTSCGSLCMLEPDMCTECNWSIISEEHLPIWREIARQQQSVLACSDIGDQGKRMARRIYEKAKITIAKLEGLNVN